MRIENKRSHEETVVTKEEWQQMIMQQTSMLFRIIDKEENIRGKINIPREIQEFRLARPERIVPKIEVSDNDMKEAEQLMEKQISKSTKK